jgi:NTP pyrophosphatase (non-canonical NTP hydrolase)
MKEDLLEIIYHYGINNQLRKLNEECYELIEAIRNYADIEPFSSENTNFKAIFKNHVVEEVADCLVLINQFIGYYDLDNNEILEVMKYKINRQLDRISKE